MHGGLDRRLGAVLLHEQVGGAVDVEVESHGQFSEFLIFFLLSSFS